MKSGGKFTLLGTTYTILPLRTLPLRGLQFIGYRVNDIRKLLNHLAELAFRLMAKIRLDRARHRMNTPGYQNIPVEVDLIVFVCDRPRVREAKLATALRKSGKRVTLLFNTAPNYKLSAYFDAAIRYKYGWQALLKALKFNPLIFHVFTLWNYETAYLFARYQPGKIVIDTNDTIVGTASAGYIAESTWLHESVEMERYVLENADGLCCRDLQVQNACRTGKYHRVKNSLFFPEYLWSKQDLSTVLERSQPRDPHIVLIGHFGNKAMGDEKEAGYLDIIRILTGQCIHFHIYPHWFYNNKVYFKDGVESIFSEYFEMEASNPYFHIHATVPMEDVVREISQYDFGIHVLRSVLFEEPYERYTTEAMKICTSARISDYLEAGLPMIGTTGTYMYRLLSRYGVMVGLTRDNIFNFKPLLMERMNGSTRDDLNAVQNRYLLAGHAPRLIDFYNCIQVL